VAELHVHFDLVAGELLFVALPALVQPIVPLGSGQAVELGPLQDPPHGRGRDNHVVVPLQAHGHLGQPEIVVLAQVQELANHFGLGRTRTCWDRVERSRKPSRPCSSWRRFQT
jgi:hypothetical protein